MISFLRICILLTLSVHFFLSADAKTIYFSTMFGDDSRTLAQAQNVNTPWKTIARLNSIFSTLSPGDIILFNRGEIFDGSIIVGKSGTAAQPIIISAYGTGNKPVINGFTSLTNWVSVGNGIWEVNVTTSATTVNSVVVNGTEYSMGRYPNGNSANKGYLLYEAHSANSITDNELASAPNWSGAEVVIRKLFWILDRNKVTNHSGRTLTYTSGSTYTPWEDKSGYFIQNDIKTLDIFGEWYFNPNTKKLSMYFGSNNPSAYVVQASASDKIVTLSHMSNVSFNNLTFQGANAEGFSLSFSNNVNISYCDILFSGTDAINVSNSADFKIENSYLANSNNNGISLEYGNTNATIRNNKIENTHMYAGMGKSGDGNGIAIQAITQGGLIEYNDVINTGYTGIYFLGSSVVVKNNFINNYCLVKDDGAGIYTNTNANESGYFGRKIVGNIVLNGIGVPEGNNDVVAHAHGIYLDGITSNLEVSNNTVSNAASYGIFSPNPLNVSYKNNTVYNNRVQFVINRSISSGLVQGNEIVGNKFFSKVSSQMASAYSTLANDINLFGRFDSNFYARPFSDNTVIYSSYFGASGETSEIFDLESWKAKYSKDATSKKSPVQFPGFIINSLIGSNKFSNGFFNSDISDVGSWSALNNIVTSYNAGGVLDGGSLQVGFNIVPGRAGGSLITMNVGALSAAKNYVLKYSLKGSNNNYSLGIFLRKNADPYNPVTDFQYSRISTTRTENELLFSVPADQPDATLVFTIDSQDIQFWLDNIRFYEADVTITNPDDYIRFEYNGTQSVKSVALDKTYVDLNNITQPATITLAPYTSIILLKQSSATRSDQTVTFPSIPTKVYNEPSFLLGATASSGLPITYRVVSGPATLSGNTVSTLTGVGNVVIEASQAGNASYNAAAPVLQTFAVIDNVAPVITAKNITVQSSPNGVATIQPSDIIQSVTDFSGVDNSSIQISNNSFSCSSSSSGTTTGADHQAYIATRNTGTQSFGGELGMDFRVNNVGGIVIKQLGAFDHLGNGIIGTQSGGIRVAIFNKTTRTIVPGLDVIISGTADAYTGNHRMKNVTPITLIPGEYTVVAKGYNSSELNGNTEGGTPFAAGDLAGGAITYTGSGSYGSPAAGFSYPVYLDGGGPNRYLAGSFSYGLPGATAIAVTRQAYTAAGTTGTQSFGGELGMDFKVNNAAGVVIKQLGVFDHQGNGIVGTQSGGIRVAIFNKVTRTIVPGLDVIVTGAADAYTGNHRMKNVTATTLPVGEYTVVAKGYNSSELNGNSEGGTPFATGDLGGGAITLTGSGAYGSPAAGFSYPQYVDGGGPNRYLAGTFSYEVSGAAAGNTTQSVQISARDIYGNLGQATAIVTIACQQTQVLTSLQNEQATAIVTIACQQTQALASLQNEQATAMSLNLGADKGSTSIKLFPNPSKGQFAIELFNNLSSKISFQIITKTGKVITQKQLNNTTHTSSIKVDFDISNQSAGMYFLKIMNGTKLHVEKLILIH